MEKKSFLLFIFILMISVLPMTAFASEQSVDETTLSVTEDGQVVQEFTVSNLMPGDTVYQNFDLVISHDNDVKVSSYFESYENSSAELLSALQISVYLPQVDKIIFEGSIEDFSLNEEIIYVESGSANKSTVNYEITLSLSTEVGNECMNTEIFGQFVWLCEDVESIPETDDDTDTDTDTDTDDDIVVIPPETGDTSNNTVIIVVSVISVCGVITLLYFRNRRKKDE